jgi:arabinogalactan oligomer / maltooligosaccharide transport system substrate-binding protein
VIVGAHDWTGELAANGSVVQIFPRAAVRRQVPGYAMRAFSYGGRQFGMPVALENVGLFVNTRIAKVPKTWNELERRALAFQRRGGGRIGLAVQQGAGGDAYHMYPFFSGLCGYVFSATRTGALNPRSLGVANPRFLRNAPLIDKWNRERLINSKVDSATAQAAFTAGKAAYWITGPWNIDALRKAGIRFQIIQVPRIKCRSVPFLGVQGFLVTRFAAGHGVLATASLPRLGISSRATWRVRGPSSTWRPRTTATPPTRLQAGGCGTPRSRRSAAPARAAFRCRTSPRWPVSGAISERRG